MYVSIILRLCVLCLMFSRVQNRRVAGDARVSFPHGGDGPGRASGSVGTGRAGLPNGDDEDAPGGDDDLIRWLVSQSVGNVGRWVKSRRRSVKSRRRSVMPSVGQVMQSVDEVCLSSRSGRPTKSVKTGYRSAKSVNSVRRSNPSVGQVIASVKKHCCTSSCSMGPIRQSIGHAINRRSNTCSVGQTRRSVTSLGQSIGAVGQIGQTNQ